MQKCCVNSYQRECKTFINLIEGELIVTRDGDRFGDVPYNNSDMLIFCDFVVLVRNKSFPAHDCEGHFVCPFSGD